MRATQHLKALEQCLVFAYSLQLVFHKLQCKSTPIQNVDTYAPEQLHNVLCS